MNLNNKILLLLFYCLFSQATIASESASDDVYVAEGNYSARTYSQPLAALLIQNNQLEYKLYKIFPKTICSSGSHTAAWLIENGALFLTKITPLCVAGAKEVDLGDLFPNQVELSKTSEGIRQQVKAVWFSGHLRLETPDAPHFPGPCGFRQWCPEWYDSWVIENGQVVRHEHEEDPRLAQYKACEFPKVNDVQFEAGSAALTRSSILVLSNLLERIKKFRIIREIQIFIASDVVITDRNRAQQQQLANDRMLAIRKYLELNGISPEKISVSPFENDGNKHEKVFILINGECRYY